MKNKSIIQILFIIFFVGTLLTGVYSNNLSYLPNQLTFENIIFLLLPAVFYSELDLVFSQNIQEDNSYERFIAYVFTFFMMILYFMYAIKLIILLYQNIS